MSMSRPGSNEGVIMEKFKSSVVLPDPLAFLDGEV